MATTAANSLDAGKPRIARRQYLINPTVQWKYTGWVALGVFIVSIFMSMVLFTVLYQQARARIINPVSATPGENTTVLMLSALAFAGVMAAGLSVWSILVTHRFCGPLHVLGGFFDELASGRFPSRRALRKKDEFKGLHEGFWRVVDRLKSVKRAEVTTLTEALKMVRSLSDADAESRKKDIAAIAATLDTMRADAARALGEDTAAFTEPTRDATITAGSLKRPQQSVP